MSATKPKAPRKPRAKDAAPLPLPPRLLAASLRLIASDMGKAAEHATRSDLWLLSRLVDRISLCVSETPASVEILNMYPAFIWNVAKSEPPPWSKPEAGGTVIDFRTARAEVMARRQAR